MSNYPPGCSGPPEPSPSPVEMFELAVSRGEVKLEDEDSGLLEQLYDLEASSDLVEKFALFFRNMGEQNVRSGNGEWWYCHMEGVLTDAGLSPELIQEIAVGIGARSREDNQSDG